MNQNIINKIYSIQSEIKELVRNEENKFQKYQFFNELQVLRLLKPLIKEHKLVIFLSDDKNSEFVFQKDGNQYLVKYLKKLEILNFKDKTNAINQNVSKETDNEKDYKSNLSKESTENQSQGEEKLTFYFWAIGTNTDPAKAKGAAETYAVKYLLSKFFLMPVRDESDPDYGVNDIRRENKEEILRRNETKRN